MQLIGFNFKKISCTKEKNFLVSDINTDIQFKDFEKEEVELLKDQEAMKVTFSYKISYNEKDKKETQLGEIIFEGMIIIASKPEEIKEILKSWKKKQISQTFQVPFFNLIMKKCLPKAIFLADEMSMPSPIALPQIQLKKKES